MKKFFSILIGAVLAFSVLAGCSETSAGKVYGKEDTNIIITEGDEFTIQLEENPTTGYGWTVSISDDSIVKLTDDQYTIDSKGKNIEGAGGVHAYAFETPSKGTAQITFVYEHSFEENSAIETVVYNITVKQS